MRNIQEGATGIGGVTYATDGSSAERSGGWRASVDVRQRLWAGRVTFATEGSSALKFVNRPLGPSSYHASHTLRSGVLKTHS